MMFFSVFSFMFCVSALDLYIYIFFFNKFIYFVCLVLAVLGLHCCARAFSNCSKQGLLFVAVRRLRAGPGRGQWEWVVFARLPGLEAALFFLGFTEQ